MVGGGSLLASAPMTTRVIGAGEKMISLFPAGALHPLYRRFGLRFLALHTWPMANYLMFFFSSAFHFVSLFSKYFLLLVSDGGVFFSIKFKPF